MGWNYSAGVSGTVTLPAGAVVLSIRAESHAANGSVVIFGGDTAVIDGSAAASGHSVASWQFPSQQCVAQGSGTALQIVFANTRSYFVEYLT
jgi:hypothetical protein